MANIIQKATTGADKPTETKAKQSLNTMLNAFLDREGMRKRFDELLGERAPQFISSIVTLMTSTPQLQQAFYDAPMTIVQSALKAATYDLPIDPSLGLAYIVPFNNKQPDGTFRAEAQFIMGYRGLYNLARRTNEYLTINVSNVRAGEFKGANYLTGEIDFDWIQDVDEREKAPIIGYSAYIKFLNGGTQQVYMTLSQIDAHEKKHRKGKYRSKGWNDNYEAMCEKTVLKKVLSKWGIISIDYKTAPASVIAAAEAIAKNQLDDEDLIPIDNFEVSEDSEVPPPENTQETQAEE